MSVENPSAADDSSRHARLPSLHRQKIRDLGYESCSVTPVNRNRSLFLEASVNRIKTYCNWFLLRPSHPYLRENKTIANN